MLAHSNPEIAGAVADEARKVAFRVPSTDASLANRHPISNRHPCRLETTLKSLRINGRTSSNRSLKQGGFLPHSRRAALAAPAPFFGNHIPGKKTSRTGFFARFPLTAFFVRQY